jgi:hypothetical protein
MIIDCHKCIYYYVTWNANFPHGCRAMGFKSRRYPINEVRNIMNAKDCLLFTAIKVNEAPCKKLRGVQAKANKVGPPEKLRD